MKEFILDSPVCERAHGVAQTLQHGLDFFEFLCSYLPCWYFVKDFENSEDFWRKCGKVFHFLISAASDFKPGITKKIIKQVKKNELFTYRTATENKGLFA